MQLKSETTAFQQKLQQLTQFNHALVYGFEPEGSPKCLAGSTKNEDYLYPIVGQYEDMLEGYLFAQNSLLPAIKSIEEDKLTETDFINLIKQLHKNIGNTVLGMHGLDAGAYTQTRLTRWNPSTKTSDLLCAIVFGDGKSADAKHFQQELIELLNTTLKLTKEEVLQFIALVLRIKEDKSILIPSHLKAVIGENYELALFEKLAFAVALNKLTEEEKGLLNKIVIICRDPREIPKAMENYAKTTFANWKACNKQNAIEVSEFLAETFYQLTDIHPFGNGNGRTATCLINVFLRAINWPSILIRNPGDKGNTLSTYSLAMDSITHSRTPFAKHIMLRIKEAQIKPYSDKTREHLIGLRCQLASQLKAMHAKHPTIDVECYMDKKELFIPHIFEMANLSEEAQTIFMLKILLAFLIKEEQRLDEAKSPPKVGQLFKAGFLTPTSTSNEQKEKLKQSLATLTGIEGWNVNPKNQLECWIEIANKETATKIVKCLKEVGIGNVALLRRPDTKVPVVKCSAINLDILHSKIGECVQGHVNTSLNIGHNVL